MRTFFLLILLIGCNTVAEAQSYKRLLGQWKGVKMVQDEGTEDENTHFLPNEGELILTERSAKYYYYPYFKSAEFKVRYSSRSIYYTINNKEIRCNYSFHGDTLAFEMHYIKKTFIKLFVPVEMDQVILSDLDRFGFRTNKLRNEYELDTLNPEQLKGVDSYDSLTFTPYHHLQFMDDGFLKINQSTRVLYKRGYKTINYTYNGIERQLRVEHVGGTQSLSLIPMTECSCDSIIIPYMTVSWADRVRQAIIDEENF